MQNMEQLKQDPEEHPLEYVRWLLDNNQGAQLWSDGTVKLYSYLEPRYQKPFFEEEFTDTQELINHFLATEPGKAIYFKPGSNNERLISDPEFLAWREALSTPADIQATAQRMLQHRRPDYSSDLIIDEEEHGSFIAKYPRVILLNETNGVQEEFIADIVKLIADGEVLCELEGHEIVNGERKYGRYTHELRLDPYIHNRIRALGLDPDNAMIVEEFEETGSLSDVESLTFGSALHQSSWSKRPDVLGIETDPKEAVPIEVLLEEAQADMARRFAAFTGGAEETKTENLDTTYVIRPVRPLQETIHDLQIAIEGFGDFRLGFVSNDVGLWACITNMQGGVIHNLSAHYLVRPVFEGAWLYFQALLRQRQE